MRWFLGFGLLFAFGLWGWQEFRLSRVSKADPQTLTCEALGRDGPGENAHVVLTDHLLLTHSFVYSSRKDEWTEAWIPAVPRGGEYHRKVAALVAADGDAGKLPPPDDLRVIVRVARPKDASTIDRLAEADTLRGLVINEVRGIPAKSRDLLATSYPGIDLGRCWILEVDRKPTSAGLGLGAIAASVVGLGVLFRFWRKRKRPAVEAPSRSRRASRGGVRRHAPRDDEGRTGDDPPDPGR